MRCEQIMKTDVHCMSQDATVVDAARRMRRENIGFLPVCDRWGCVLGAITDRDLAMRIVADELSLETRVADVMTNEVVACSPHDDLHDAERLMAEQHKGRIMCIDERGRLAGIISLTDIARHERSARVTHTLRRVSEREVRP